MRALQPGNHFGEMALMNNVKRTLSVRSVGDSTCLSLKKECFQVILGSIEKQLRLDVEKYLKDDNERELGD